MEFDITKLSGVRIAYAVTGSFCTHAATLAAAKRLTEYGAVLIPVISEKVQQTDTRFGRADDFAAKLAAICGRTPLRTIDEAEPLGPKNLCDIIAVTPCTGNTIAKLTYSITDGVVTMAVKSCIRSGINCVLTVATNDALSGSAKNIGVLMNCKPYYFTPLRQDDHVNKPYSLVADFEQLPRAIVLALAGKQAQPLLLTAPKTV